MVLNLDIETLLFFIALYLSVVLLFFKWAVSTYQSYQSRGIPSETEFIYSVIYRQSNLMQSVSTARHFTETELAEMTLTETTALKTILGIDLLAKLCRKQSIIDAILKAQATFLSARTPRHYSTTELRRLTPLELDQVAVKFGILGIRDLPRLEAEDLILAVQNSIRPPPPPPPQNSGTNPMFQSHDDDAFRPSAPPYRPQHSLSPPPEQQQHRPSSSHLPPTSPAVSTLSPGPTRRQGFWNRKSTAAPPQPPAASIPTEKSAAARPSTISRQASGLKDCEICGNKMGGNAPVKMATISCGHCYCKNCWLRILNSSAHSRTAPCPLCSKPFSRSDIRELYI